MKSRPLSNMRKTRALSSSTKFARGSSNQVFARVDRKHRICPEACYGTMTTNALLPLGGQDVSVQSCNYYARTAAGGQSINVDTCSIERASYQSVDFVYYLRNQKVVSQSNGIKRTWTTFPEGQVNRPRLRRLKECWIWFEL